jgi:peptidyl-prolyl cis-trans isomerase SurA
MSRYFAVFVAALAALSLVSCKKSPPAGVAAEVNGHAITTAELEKIYATQAAQQPPTSNADVIMSQKLDLLSSLITSEIMLQKAEKLGLTAVDADVDTDFNSKKAPYTKEEFEKLLADRHMTAADLRTQIRRDLTITKLINKEITSHIVITDADVTNFYNANKSMFNFPEPRVHLAQILVTPMPDPNVRNLKNSKAQNAQEAEAKIEDLDRRIRAGEDFALLAQNYSEDPGSAPNGGDMGFHPESDFSKMPDFLKLIREMPAGSASGIVKMQEGYRIFKMIAKEPAGQRDLNDPRTQQGIREELRSQKDQLLKAAYFEISRNGAKIQNYLAQAIVENADKSK